MAIIKFLAHILFAWFVLKKHYKYRYKGIQYFYLRPAYSSQKCQIVA